MPPNKILENSKRARNFISSKGYPRYCTVVTLPDGTNVLQGGRSRRGKPRGLPGSKDWVTALKGCDDPLFIDFLKRCLEWDPNARMTPSQALRHPWLRRRLPKPPNENPPPSRRSSAAYRNNVVPKLSNGSQVLNNTSNITNTVNNNLNTSNNNGNNTNSGGGGGGNNSNSLNNLLNGRNAFNTTLANTTIAGGDAADLNRHMKLPKIGGGSNNNLRTGS